jgi:hypothetical protein
MERTQNLGVRVHLLGLSDDTHLNQSNDLITQADTTTTWTLDDIQDLFLITEEPVEPEPEPEPEISDAIKARLIQTAQDSAQTLYLEDIRVYRANGGRGMPADVDGRLLARARAALTRNLDDAEKRYLRQVHLEIAETLLAPPADPDQSKAQGEERPPEATE